MYLCGCHVKTDVGGRAIIKERPRTIKEEQTVPESPRYLLLKGRTDDARHILEKIAHVNKKQLSPGRFVNDLSMELNEVDTIDGLEEACLLEAHGKLEESHMEIKSETGVLSQVYSLFSPSLIRSTLLLWIVLFANAFSYYGLVLLTSELSGGGGNCTSDTMPLIASDESSLHRHVFYFKFCRDSWASIVSNYCGPFWAQVVNGYNVFSYLVFFFFP